MRLAACLVLSLIICTRAADWSWRNPLPTGNFFRQLCPTDDAIYLCAETAVLISTNGYDWVEYPQQVYGPILSMAKGPEKIIAIAVAEAGPRNAFFEFSNKTLSRLSFAQIGEQKIVFGNGRFVAGGAEIKWSEDGVHWTVANLPDLSNDSRQVFDLLFANGKFLVSAGDYFGARLYVSTDGNRWDTIDNVPGAIRFSYYNGTFVAVTGRSVAYSTDARNWEIYPAPAPMAMMGVALGKPGLLIVGDSLSQPPAHCFFSADKTNWTESALPFDNRPFDLKYFNHEYLLVGEGGLIAHSSDGTNWLSQTTGPRPSISCVASSTNRIVALGVSPKYPEYQLAGMWSSNGLAWNPIQFTNSHRMTSMIYDQGRFIAIGFDGYITVSTNEGETWLWPDRATTYDLFDIISSPLGYVASGRETILQSDDGLNWRQISTAPGHPTAPGYARQIAYGNGTFIIALDQDLLFEMWVSSDLRQWTKLTTAADKAILVKFAGNRFALTSWKNDFVPPEGFDFVPRPQPMVSRSVYCNGLYFSFSSPLGFASPPDNRSDILISQDGIHWHSLARIPGLYGQALTYFDRRLFAFGSNGSVVEFQPFAFLDVEKTPNGAVKLIPTSSGTATPVIESSPDLVQWHTVSSREVSPENAQSFYRLRSN